MKNKTFRLSSLSKETQAKIKQELAADESLNYNDLEDLLTRSLEFGITTAEAVEAFKKDLSTVFSLSDSFRETLDYRKIGTVLFNFGNVISSLKAVKSNLDYRGRKMDEADRELSAKYLSRAAGELRSLLK